MGLSKEILLTVKDYEVKLNKDIKFYENDTIDLCFSILEYGIEVKNGMAVNKLMPINALKAYMLIETPQGVDYAESTKVEDNRVVFNLGDKYSQFVGIGKMQIVIKDNDGCRVTLPEFPFEIRQSINSDWDRNITVLSTEGSEIIIDEFGREIALKKISEMEETNILPIDSYSMILDNGKNKKIKTNLITQKVENDLQLINEQLETKANNDEVVKRGSGTLSDFDEETRRVLQGLKPGQINAVLGKENVKYYNTDFVKAVSIGEEIFTPKDVFTEVGASQEGYWCNPNNGEFQSTQYTTKYKHTTYIEVKENIKYIRRNKSSVVFFDSSKNYLSGMVDDSLVAETVLDITGYSFTVPLGAKYVVMNLLITHPTQYLYQVEDDGILTDNYVLKIEKLDLNNKVEVLENKVEEFKNINTIKPLQGKKIVFFGDSIVGNYMAPNDYPTIVGNITGATVYNVGFGGCRMGRHTNPTNPSHYDWFCMYKLVDAITSNDFSNQDNAVTNITAPNYQDHLNLLKTIDFNNIDIVVIAYGTNDLNGNMTGESSSDSIDFYFYRDSTRYVLDKLIKAFPHIKIMLVTPMVRTDIPGGDSDTYVNPNTGGSYPKFIEDLQVVAKEYKVPLCDNYYSMCLNKYNASYYLSDKIHPKEGVGINLIGSHVAAALLNNFSS